jgi:hypothetical protein
MNLKFVSVLAFLAAATVTAAFAQDKAPPKASKADVQKVVDSIKGDKAKLALFCAYEKLQSQAAAIAAKNENDPKLQALGQQLDAGAQKVGPDFDKLMTSDIDDASGALLENLAKSCK